MTRRVIFTKRERSRWPQSGNGYRPTNDRNSGDLPAPWAEGDIVRRISNVSDDRLHGMTGREFNGGSYFVVTYATSIDEGDAWYFRVTDGSSRYSEVFDDDYLAGSDRLHVASRQCSSYEDCDWMAGFELVETADPGGLAERAQMIADGWTPTLPAVCSECGARKL